MCHIARIAPACEDAGSRGHFRAASLGDTLDGDRLVMSPLYVRRCEWIVAPSGGSNGTGWASRAARADLGFEVKRAFWLTQVPAGELRGHHAHRESILATFAVKGRFLLHLDDGLAKQTVPLEDPAHGLVVGRFVWHDLLEFEPGTVVLVLASSLYEESDYIRDYGVFIDRVSAINA